MTYLKNLTFFIVPIIASVRIYGRKSTGVHLSELK